MSDYFMNTYHRLPVTFANGRGAWLYDTQGRGYLDLSSGIAVNCLGHDYPPLVKAIAEQAAKYCHVCNYYHSEASEAFAEKLVAACAPAGMKKVFLSNSGAEANEGVIKMARKYSADRYGPGRHTIVTLNKSFHGRTITTLAATGQEVFHKNFTPLTDGFVSVDAGDIAALDRALDPKTTAAFLLEAVQGESGVWPMSQEYVAAARRLCDERDILLIFDEVQCGMGRTGTFLALEQYRDAQGNPMRADAVTLAKALGGGIPCGAFLAGEKCADTLGVGDHGSTFGGNPVAAAAGLVVLETVNTPAMLAEIRRKGEAFKAAVAAWDSPHVKTVRGPGLMIGIDIDEPAWPILEKGVAAAAKTGKGLLLLTAGEKTLRLLPPYILADEEIAEGMAMLKELL
jgi:acetylornithine/N-succinyldiaminopimelate aminotransferase